MGSSPTLGPTSTKDTDPPYVDTRQWVTVRTGDPLSVNVSGTSTLGLTFGHRVYVEMILSHEPSVLFIYR